MSCRVVSCRVVSCRVVSCRVVSCRVVSCRVLLSYAVALRVCTNMALLASQTTAVAEKELELPRFTLVWMDDPDDADDNNATGTSVMPETVDDDAGDADVSGGVMSPPGLDDDDGEEWKDAVAVDRRRASVNTTGHSSARGAGVGLEDEVASDDSDGGGDGDGGRNATAMQYLNEQASMAMEKHTVNHRLGTLVLVMTGALVIANVSLLLLVW